MFRIVREESWFQKMLSSLIVEGKYEKRSTIYK